MYGHETTWKQRFLLGSVSVLLALLLWQIAVTLQIVNRRLLPSPVDVFHATVWMARNSGLVTDVAISSLRALTGFVTGSFAGVAVGIATVRWPLVRATVGRLIDLLRPVPAISIVPLIIIWFGLGETSKILVIFWGVFFPVWVNTHIGISRVSFEHIWSAQCLGARSVRILLEVVLPAAASSILGGMRVGLSIAYICLVAAEMAGASRGLGFRITVSHLTFQTDQLIASIIILGLIGALSDWVFMRAVHWTFPWYAQSQRTPGAD